MANGKKETHYDANEIPDSAITAPDEDDIERDEKQKKDERIKAIRERFEVMSEYWSKLHEEAIEDDNMVAGIHWNSEVKRDREDEGRPVLTYNMMPSFTRQIINRIRQDRPQIKVIPVEGNKKNKTLENVAGTKDYSMSDVYSGIIKNIEHISRADQVYDTAVTHCVNHGFGFFYLMNQYSKVNPFSQELQIYRVRNPYSIFLDPSAQEADYRDMQDAFMFSKITRSAFESKYDVEPDDYERFYSGQYDDWYEKDHVRVAQYFYIDYQDDEVILMNNGKTFYLSDVESVLDEMKEKDGIFILKEDGKELRRKVKRQVCMWMKLTGSKILEGPLELPFSAVPIFPVLGEEVLVDGDISYEGAIRHARDPQKSYNYWRTAAVETVALAPKAPYIVTNKEIEKYVDEWESANKRNMPFLRYTPDERAGGRPQRQPPAPVAAAELQNATQDLMDMKQIIGMHDASLGREGNEVSGKAIIARQNQGNTATFQFPDNLTRAQQQMGRLMVEAIPKIMTRQAQQRIRLPDDTEDFIEINQSVTDDDSGDNFLVNDIGFGRYDVIMETATNAATQRQEAAEHQLELMRILGPERSANIAHLIVDNIGLPGSAEVARILRKMLPDQLKSEEEKNADLPKGVTMGDDGQLVKDGEPYTPPPSMDQQIAMKQQQLDEQELKIREAEVQAKMATAEADKVQAQAKIEDAKADQMKTQAEMQALQDNQGKPSQDGLMTEVRDIIQKTMDEHEKSSKSHEDAITDMVTDALARIKRYVDQNLSRVTKNDF